MFGAVKIRDDRGAEVPLYVEPLLRRGQEKEAVEASGEAFSISGGRKLVWADAGWLSVCIATPLVAMVVSALMSEITHSGTVGWVLAFAAVIVAGALVGSSLNRRVSKERVKVMMLKARRCPSCGYGLEELKVEDDGCVVCAECGGAWRARFGVVGE